jgi:hypothetical protein
MRCYATPTIQRPEQAVDGCLECPRVVADVAGFSDRLVDYRIKRDDASNDLASLGLGIRQLWSRKNEHAPESNRDLGRKVRD